MFNNLLVPIDGSMASDRLVSKVLDAAKRGNVHITFFNVGMDYAATRDGALAHAAWPAEFENFANANSLRILAKAEAAARAAGVPCKAEIRRGARVHEVIHEAAVEFGCDVIYIASRGGGAMTRLLNRSVTARLIEISTLPVLVINAQNEAALSDEEIATGILREEHRSLAAVLHAMKDVIARGKLSGQSMDIRLLRAMLYYVEVFPEQLHHPKEEAYIFSKLRDRAPEYRQLLEHLQSDHNSGAERLREMRAAVDALAHDPVKELPRFEAAAEQFIADQFKHMTLEEKSLMPAVRVHLFANDWSEIKHAFQKNGDPRFGANSDEPFDHLLGRILSLANQDATKAGSTQ